MSEYSLITQFPTGPTHESARERLARFERWRIDQVRSGSLGDDALVLLSLECQPMLRAAQAEEAQEQAQTN